MANQLRSTGEYLPMNLPPRPTGYSIRPLTRSVRIPGRRGLRILAGIRMIPTEGELRRGRNTFASGFESGQWGVTTDGSETYVDLSWLEQIHDAEALSDSEVGSPMSNAKLPTIVTRYVRDDMYVSLDSAISDCSMDRLTDIVDLYREDVAADEFHLDTRGITNGQNLSVCGEPRVQAGEFSVIGTDETPHLIPDDGREELKRQLLWRGIKYSLALVGALALGALFLF
jgi:hypothetical protein